MWNGHHKNFMAFWSIAGLTSPSYNPLNKTPLCLCSYRWSLSPCLPPPPIVLSAHQRQDTGTCWYFMQHLILDLQTLHYFFLSSHFRGLRLTVCQNQSISNFNFNKSTAVLASFILSAHLLLSCFMVPKYQCGDDAMLVQFVEHLNCKYLVQWSHWEPRGGSALTYLARMEPEK